MARFLEWTGLRTFVGLTMKRRLATATMAALALSLFFGTARAQTERAAASGSNEGDEHGEEEDIPQSVQAQTGAGTGAGGMRFGGIFILEQQLGSGTFVKDSYARNPYYAWLLSLRPRFYFTNHLFVELRVDLQQELTTSYATTTTKKRQLMPSDTLLTIRYQSAYKIPVLGISISPYFRIAAPTSYESQYRDLYLSVTPAFDLQKLIGPVLVTYIFRFTKNFNKYTVATVPKDVETPVSLARIGGAEDLGSVIATGKNNISFSVFNALMLTYIINAEWSASLYWGVANAWTYKSYPEQPNAKGGRGQRDVMYGVVDISYQPWKHLGFSFGVYTKQPVKTNDNKTIRFPFYDIHTPGNNYTVWYLDVVSIF